VELFAFFVESLRRVLPQSSEDHPRSEPIQVRFLRRGYAEEHDVSITASKYLNCWYFYHLLRRSRYAAVTADAVFEHGGQSKQIPSVSKTWSHFLFRVVLLVYYLYCGPPKRQHSVKTFSVNNQRNLTHPILKANSTRLCKVLL
jgi:hypothetical protein